MNKTKMHKLYDAIVKKEELTLDKLLLYNFTKDEVRYLVSCGILSYRNGIFTLKDVKDLVEYGKKLYWYKNYAESDLVFARAVEIDSTCLILKFKKIYDHLRFDAYRLAISEIKELEKYDKLNADLLSFLIIYAFPEYRDDFDNIEKINYLCCYKRMDEQYKEMKNARNKLANFQFQPAMGIISKINYNETIDFRCETIKRLAYKCARRQDKVADTINGFFENKKMTELKHYLESQPILDSISYAIFHLLRSYDEMIKTGNSPLIMEYNSLSMFGLIKRNNFALALDILQEKSKKYSRTSHKGKLFDCIEYLLEENLKLQQQLSDEKVVKSRGRKVTEV